MLICSCLEKYIISFQSFVACNGICQNSLLFLLGLLDDLAGLAVCFNDAVYKFFHDIPPAMLYII